MRKKTKSRHRSGGSSRGRQKVVINSYNQTPSKYLGRGDPLNLEEQKLNFLYHGITPEFKFRGSAGQEHTTLPSASSKMVEIKHELLPLATRILDKVSERFGNGEGYMERAFGPRINSLEGSEALKRYMAANDVDGKMSITWSVDLSCSGRMCWVGPCLRANKPDARRYRLMLKDSPENCFLREHGIFCIANHEIGTHFIRSYNDGLQPWFSNRQRFGLGRLSSHTLRETEEGLAALNTVLNARSNYLFYPALLYYTACKSEGMSFHELFDHLECYVRDSDLRWKYVMRVKRHLPDPSMQGGNGRDQCYFTGAVDILRHLDQIDFNILYSGKISLGELKRVKHMARLTSIKLPHFMWDIEAYVSKLRKIALFNEIHKKPSNCVKLEKREPSIGHYQRFRSRSVCAKRASYNSYG